MIGDLMMRNMDWPGADEIADRLQMMLPPELQKKDDEGDSPEVQQVKQQAQQIIEQMQQQMQQMDQAIGQLSTENAQLTDDKAIEQGKLQLDQLEAQNKQQMDEAETKIKAFEAETKRMKTAADIEAQGQDANAAALESMQQIMGQMGSLFEPDEVMEVEIGGTEV
jgi:ABC-type transporter Mla subunit MlaD